MTYEYDFEMVKRAYAEMARRAREKDEVRRPARNAMSTSDVNSGSKVTTARPAVACTFIESDVISPRQRSRVSLRAA